MTEIEYTREDRVALLKKINKAREDIQKCDWMKDKFLSYGGKSGYRYISVDKMKANVAPILQKHGLEWKVDFNTPDKAEPLQSLPQHWIIRLDVELIDIDTGYSICDVVYGEAGDTLDKGVTKAESYALKTWLAMKFMIADGMDPDAEDTSAPTVPFKPKTPAEQTQVISKTLGQGVAPAAPAAPAAPPVPTPAPAPVMPPVPKAEPAKKVPAVPKVSGPTESAPKKRLKKEPEVQVNPDGTAVVKSVSAPEPTGEPMTAVAKEPTAAEKAIEELRQQKIQQYTENMTVIKKNMLSKKVENYTKAIQQSKITSDKAKEFAKRCAEIGSDAEFTQFIQDFPEIQVDE